MLRVPWIFRGLNESFIREHELPWIENLETGSGKDLASTNHPDHDKPYVQNWLDEYGPRKVEANALVTQPEAGKRLFRETVESYLGEDPTANQRQRKAEIRKKIKTRLSKAGLDDKTLREALDRLGEDSEE